MASLHSAQAYRAFAKQCRERAYAADSFVDQLYLLQRAEAWRRQAKAGGWLKDSLINSAIPARGERL